MGKRHHIPLRTCVGCRQKRPKRELVRFVCGSNGELILDPRQILPGRGGYLCADSRCLQLAIKSRAFSRPLKATVRFDAERLKEEFATCLMWRTK